MYEKISQDFHLVSRFLSRRQSREKTLDLNWRVWLRIAYEYDEYYETKTKGNYWRAEDKTTTEDLCSAADVLNGNYTEENAFKDALEALDREQYYWSNANTRRARVFPYRVEVSICDEDGETVYDCGREHNRTKDAEADAN